MPYVGQAMEGVGSYFVDDYPEEGDLYGEGEYYEQAARFRRRGIGVTVVVLIVGIVVGVFIGLKWAAKKAGNSGKLL